MKVTASAVLLLATTSLVSSLSIRSTRYSKDAISRRESEPEARVLSGPLSERFDEELLNHLEKRRGGGGSGGGGGGGGRSGSSSGSSGSSSGGAAGGAAGGSRSTGSASSSSSANRGYGGGAYYGGGSSGAYRAGGRSPLGILPFALGGAALGFFPGLWLYGAYAYPYSHPYGFRNQTNNQNESLPIQCLCAQYSACGCDDNNNSTFLDSIIGNGSASDEDSTLVHIGDVNGTKTLIINGTLPNGTDNSTTAAPTSTASSAATRQIVENSGFWVMGSIVGATVWLL